MCIVKCMQRKGNEWHGLTYVRPKAIIKEKGGEQRAVWFRQHSLRRNLLTGPLGETSRP